MRHELLATHTGKIELRVTDDDGRTLINICKDEAHAAICIPILERMLAREQTSGEFEAGGWRRRMPLEPGATDVVGLRGKRMHP